MLLIAARWKVTPTGSTWEARRNLVTRYCIGACTVCPTMGAYSCWVHGRDGTEFQMLPPSKGREWVDEKLKERGYYLC